MAEYLLCFFSILWYIFMIQMFFSVFGGRREQIKAVSKLGIAIAWGLISYCVIQGLDKNIITKQLLLALLSSVALWALFRVKYLKSVSLVFMYHCICFVIQYIVLVLVKHIFPSYGEEILYHPLVSSLLMAISNMLEFCFLITIRRCFARKNSEVLTGMEWFRFSLFPVFTLISTAGILMNFDVVQNDQQKNLLLVIVFGLLIMNVVVFYLLHDILQREMQIREDKLFKERVKNETAMYRSVSENYEKRMRREHEYKNHITCIAALVREKKYSELATYLNELNIEISNHMDAIDTNHVIVNAILNSKYQETREKGIVFVMRVNDLSDMEIKDEDIVVMLSNLLNNAIEACIQCEKKILKLKFIKENGQMILSVINTYVKKPIEKDYKFLTGKAENKEEHGIGIENVKNTVEKYGGSYVVRYDESQFYFTIMIPCKNKEAVS